MRDPRSSQTPFAPGTDTPSPARRESPADGTGTLLQVYEMFRLRLSAEVVVCSACQSSLGPVRAGEGSSA
ncbi:hypothetical protein ACFOOM_28170 [Streptomyces echinoruber]|uniref:hypothetical protein n=1 Tax=Streptomyces echinoruber TaxID=68898 RepID=UPI00167D1B4A|nr:hypothetical protein [Streptomyces echinoruber]